MASVPDGDIVPTLLVARPMAALVSGACGSDKPEGACPGEAGFARR